MYYLTYIERLGRSSQTEFTQLSNPSAKLTTSLDRKHTVFQQTTDTTRHLFRTLLTTFPPSGDMARYGIDQVVVLDDLFAP